MDAFQSLKNSIIVPWDTAKERADPNPRCKGWMCDETKAMLLANIKPGDLVIELGAWIGLSARLFLEYDKDIRVISIDTWLGSANHQTDENHATILPRLYETYLDRMNNYKDRIIPLRMKTILGMGLCFNAGVKPDVVYVDAAHDYKSVCDDVRQAAICFPKAKILGDDYRNEEVGKAVRHIHAWLRDGLEYDIPGTWEVTDNTRAWKLVRINTEGVRDGDGA